MIIIDLCTTDIDLFIYKTIDSDATTRNLSEIMTYLKGL